MQSNPTPSKDSVLDFTSAARLIESNLRVALESMPARPDRLRDAVEHSLLSGGKRLRPVLVLLCAQSTKGSVEYVINAAVAVEMIHCFSLIHDDLPALDNDTLRRGQPTSHVKFGEDLAILAGDALATWPYGLILKSDALSTEVRARLVLELVEATANMIDGQVYDTLGGFPKGMPPTECLELTHRNKTGALIRCACRMGAIAGSANDEIVAALTIYGESIGLMFQVVDDILDVTQTTEHLGKSAGKDAAQEKLTYPSVIGLDASKRRVSDLAQQAYQSLDEIPQATALHLTAPLRSLVDTLVNRTC